MIKHYISVAMIGFVIGFIAPIIIKTLIIGIF